MDENQGSYAAAREKGLLRIEPRHLFIAAQEDGIACPVVNAKRSIIGVIEFKI